MLPEGRTCVFKLLSAPLSQAILCPCGLWGLVSAVSEQVHVHN